MKCAITVKVLPATDTEGALIEARCFDDTYTVPDNQPVHGIRFKEVAIELAKKLGMATNLVGGWVNQGTMAFVPVEGN